MTREHHIFRLMGQRTPHEPWELIASSTEATDLVVRLGAEAKYVRWWRMEIRPIDDDEALASWVRPHNS